VEIYFFILFISTVLQKLVLTPEINNLSSNFDWSQSDVNVNSHINLLSRFIPEGVAEADIRYSSGTSMFFQNYLAMRNTTDVVRSGKPITVYLKCKCNPWVAFYDIHGWKRIVLFICWCYSKKCNIYFNAGSLYFS
jgi:hypothetical protein